MAIDTHLDLPGLAGAQGPLQDHMGKDKGSLGVVLLIEHPSPLCSQYYSKPAPHLTGGMEY